LFMGNSGLMPTALPVEKVVLNPGGSGIVLAQVGDHGLRIFRRTFLTLSGRQRVIT
jgi:hypothetical protein